MSRSSRRTAVAMLVAFVAFLPSSAEAWQRGEQRGEQRAGGQSQQVPKASGGSALGRSASGQQATPQSKSTGRRTPPASSGTRNSGAANSGTNRQSAPSAASSTPSRASTVPQTGSTRSPANASPPSRSAISPNRTNATDPGINPVRQPPANRPTRPETNETGAGSTSPSSPAAKPARPTPNAAAADSSGSESASRGAGNDSGLHTVAPTEQMVPKPGRTALEVLGEEGFKEMGLPEEARNVDMQTVLHLATQKMIRDKYGIPKDSTKDMAPEDMLEIVGQLQLFDAEEHVNSQKFWGDVGSGGLDSALGPIVSDKLGLPKGIRAGSPASKVLDDAGQLQELDMDLGDRGNWELLNDFQNGKLTPDQFVDRVNQMKSGRNGPGRGTVGGGNHGTGNGGGRSPNTPPGTDGPELGGLGVNNPGGKDSSNSNSSQNDLGGKPNAPPAAGSTAPPPGSTTAGRGGTAPGAGSTGSTPPGSRNSGNNPPGSSNTGTGTPNSGGSPSQGSRGGGLGGAADKPETNDDGLQVEAVLGGGSYVVVTHNDDGSYTADVIQADGNGNQTVVQSETFTDTDGDGTYTGDKGGESASKPKQGVYEGEETEEGTTFTYESESSSSDSSDSSSGTETDSSDAGDDVDTSDVDEYTPGRDGEYIMPLAQRLTYMQSLMQALNDTKWTPGKGGNDSTPNPQNESFGGGTRPYNPKDTVKRPIDGSSVNSGAKVPLDALQQIQDPNKVQGDVIDPTKID